MALVDDRAIELTVQQDKREARRSIPIGQITKLSEPTPTWVKATAIGPGVAVVVITVVLAANGLE